MGEPTAPQAQPVEGRSFPTTARGARPTFFDDDGATDAVLAIVTALAAEVWALRERQATLEAVLAQAGIDATAAIEAYRPDGDETAARAAEAAAFAGRVYRVFEEMREEAMAGETQDRYLQVVDRAFAEL
ncbi:hypothetical protein [Candidatus Poriferisodalis sp.]|uniref:hypothetical protein n=1 Tax=Candidatus Poriferisodalis sp. TaxID=3101277 RepID=UPI003B0150F5